METLIRGFSPYPRPQTVHARGFVPASLDGAWDDDLRGLLKTTCVRVNVHVDIGIRRCSRSHRSVQ